MRRLRLPPPAALAPFVEAFEVIESDEGMTRTLVPDGRMVLGFRYRGHAELLEGGGATRLADAVVTGLRATSRSMRTSPHGGLLLTVFRPGGATAFLPQPLHELWGEHVPLDALLPRRAVLDTLDQVVEASGHAARAASVAALLLAHRRGVPRDPLVNEAMRAIATAPTSIRIGELATQVGVGQDTLEKRFRRAIGATPKQLASILRLRAAVEGYRGEGSLTRLALDAGYFDQSHFVRALRSATGESPLRFFRAARWC